MKISLLTLLLQGIPESVALVTLAFVIAHIPLKWLKIIFIGTLLAVCAYEIRQLPIPFGLHIIINLILLFIFLIREGQTDLSLSLISSIFSYLALIILETVSTSLLIPVFGVSLNMVSKNIGIWILLGEPQVLLLFVLAFVLDKLYIKRGRKNEFIAN